MGYGTIGNRNDPHRLRPLCLCKGGKGMTDQDRIARLERVVELLISWLHRELGTSAAQALLKDLKDDRT
jgi:hypothetical protein